ncbi:MAG: methylenetetrahydrofolate--tRNA-(uracil(54)-C(5))-methyltransferase (FADH(2)-oxidizing) TrmFO [Clostridia bacterium]|nr:methylenetetrahydrofolate--tRNA-(uracil(54)-C(5))-methyltransferase (FADH(2)-oxidizing) TrmFO [Clostridia bacterium]
MSVTVIGAGLAGCEAAWQLVKRGVPVTLIEQKPHAMSPAHHSPLFAELVCSNSLRSDRLQNAVGLLKEELRRLDSLILAAADKARVPAGGALAVDRDTFSGYITETLKHHPLVTIVYREVTEIPAAPSIIATGPLTSDALASAIAAMPEISTLNFYDAAAPIVTAESLDMSKVFRASRYGRGDDYLNCPMTREEYDAFVEALLSAETAPVHGFEEKKVFEGCMPVESMARRGHMVLAFGPLKPVGLPDPRTGKEPYAVVQLRQDDAAGTLYNLVGFQTRLKFPEQKRVFGLIPGLENAEFARYGVMHRNTFLNSPGILDDHFQMIARPGLYFAGQMTGVEGYVESAASGFVAGVSAAMQQLGRPLPAFTRQTAIGALAQYVAAENRNFQPMNVTFGIMEGWPEKVRGGKQARYEKIAQRALAQTDALGRMIGPSD